jgi:hypothetical protein
VDRATPDGRRPARTRASHALNFWLANDSSSHANFAYATGTSSSVRNRQSDWPPMMVTAIADRCVPPIPSPTPWQKPGDDRGGRHQDRPEARPTRLVNGLFQRHALGRSTFA